MISRILPVDFPNTDERIYAGFWKRFGAFWLDFLITAPFTFGLVYFYWSDRLNYVYAFIPSHLFFFVYHIYFVKLWGGTPGKLIAKAKIIKKDGNPVGWREAILRNAVQWVFNTAMGFALILTLLNMSDSEYLSVRAVERIRHTLEMAPAWHQSVNWVNQIWIWSEFIVLLFNKRKRALHDFIAGTVVIKKELEDAAEQFATADRLGRPSANMP